MRGSILSRVKVALNQAAARGPDRVLFLGDFLHRAPGCHRIGRLLQNIPLRSRLGIVVAGLKQQPLFFFLARTTPRADQVPAPLQLLAIEFECEVALFVALHRIAFWPPKPAIPDHDRAAAIFAFGDDPFEIAIIDGVILDMDGEALFLRIEARPFGHRPALEDAPKFKPEIVMQAPRGMLLNHEAQPFLAFCSNLSAGLRRFGEIADFAVAAEIAFSAGPSASLARFFAD